MTAEITLANEHEKLVETLKKCNRLGRRGHFAAKVAERRFGKRLESIGFECQQIYAELCLCRELASRV